MIPTARLLWRAYSMVSAPGQPWLEFYSIVVPEGLFSPRMARLAPGDALYVEKAPYGFLTLERFAPGGDLWLLASGTGLSAYLSILRDPRSGAPTAASSWCTASVPPKSWPIARKSKASPAARTWSATSPPIRANSSTCPSPPAKPCPACRKNG